MRANSVSKLAVMEIVAEETITTVRTKRHQNLAIALVTLVTLLQAAITATAIQTSQQSVYI